MQYAKRIGADLVGMSTALEAIAGRHAGMEVFGISLVTNLAAGISPQPLSHQEVIESGQAAGPRISRLLAGHHRQALNHVRGRNQAGKSPASGRLRPRSG